MWLVSTSGILGTANVANSNRNVASPERIPLRLEYALYVLFILFAVANIYNHTLTAPIALAKWTALIITNIMLLYEVRARRGIAAAVPVIVLLSAFLVSLIGSSDLLESVGVFLSILLVMFAAVGIASVLNTLERIARFFVILSNVGRAVILSSFAMWLAGINLGRGGGRFAGWVDNPNTLALMISPTLVVLLAILFQKGRRLPLGDLAVLAIGLLLLKATDSRASLIYMVMAGAALLFARFGLGWAGLFGGAGLSAMVGWSNELTVRVYELFGREDAYGAMQSALSGREEMWPLGLRIFNEGPLIGHGIGMSSRLIQEWTWTFTVSQGLHFHNSYLTIAVECGLLGLVPFLCVLVVAIVRGSANVVKSRRWRSFDWRIACPLAIVCGAVGHAFFETWLISAGNVNALTFWVCLLLLWVPVVEARRASRANLGSVTK